MCIWRRCWPICSLTAGWRGCLVFCSQGSAHYTPNHSGTFCRVWAWGANIILMLERQWTPLCCGGGYSHWGGGFQSSKYLENLYTKLKLPFGVWDTVAPITYFLLFFIIRDCKSTTFVLLTCQSPPCPVYFIRKYSHISQIPYRHFLWMLSSLLNNKNTRT